MFGFLRGLSAHCSLQLQANSERARGGMELGSRACATVLNFIPTDNTLFHFLQVPIEQQKLTAKIPYKFRQIEILTKIC